MKRSLTILYLGTLAFGWAACSTTGGTRNVKFWNPATWFSHHAAAVVDAAKAQEQQAQSDRDQKKEQAIHAAHVEFAKAGVAAPALPAGPEADLVKRFDANGLGLLDQVDPLTGEEMSDVRQIVADLLSKDAARVAAAEEKQSAAEGNLTKLSRDYTDLQAKYETTKAELDAANAKLRMGYDRENALANEERNEVFRRWACIVVIILLVLLSLYLRMGLGGVGEAVAELPKVLGPEGAGKVVSLLDGATDALHQHIISAARKRVESVKKTAGEILGIQPTTPITPATQPPA